MRVLIIGCGFLGSKLAKKLRARGDYVTVTTTNPENVSLLREYADRVAYLNTEDSLESIIADQQAIIVCAAPKTVEEYEHAYLSLAKRLAQALKGNHKVTQLIYTSSCSVYGEQSGQWVNEEHPLNPTNEKQKILIETEKVYLNAANPLKVAIFRLGELYGLEKCIGNKVKRLAGKAFPYSPNNYTNLVHVKDVVRAIEWALSTKAMGLFNLCNDCHLLRKDFYATWCEALNLSPIEFDHTKINIHRGNKRVSNHKIKLMGFNFEYAEASPLEREEV